MKAPSQPRPPRASDIPRQPTGFIRRWTLIRGSAGSFSGPLYGKLFSSILVVGGMTFLVKIAAMGKTMVFASVFGVDAALDCYLLAYTAVAFGVNVIGEPFSVAVLPHFIRVRRRNGTAPAARLVGQLLSFFLLALLSTLVLFAIFAPEIVPVLSRQPSGHTAALTLELFRIMLPLLVFTALTYVFRALLSSLNVFLLPASTPLLVPLGASIVVLLWKGPGRVQALTAVTVLAATLETLLLAGYLYSRGLSLRPRLPVLSPQVRMVLHQYLPLVGGAVLMSNATLVDQVMASGLGSGSVASLGYGTGLVNACRGIGAVALATAFLPFFSGLVAEGRWTDLRSAHRTLRRYTLLASIPPTVFLSFLAPDLVRLLFERGQFTQANTETVAWIQTCYAFQLPFYLSNIVGVRLASALSRNHILTGLAAFNLAVNIAGNLVFSRFMGVAGIALSTTLVYFLGDLLLHAHLRRALRESEAEVRGTNGLQLD